MANRVLKSGDYKITYRFEQHAGFGKGVDVINQTKKADGNITHTDGIITHSDGTVIKVVNNMSGKGKNLDSEGMGYGNYVAILHKDNVVTLYGHLAKVYVDYGNGVKKGREIGFMGDTGYANGVHLHFEVRKYRVTPTKDNLNQTALFDFVDPTPYLDKDLPKNEYYSLTSAPPKVTLNENSYKDYGVGEYYRVRKAFDDTKSSKGSFTIWKNAYLRWKSYQNQGYHIYDNNGKQLDGSVEVETPKVETKPQLTEKSYPDYTGIGKYYYVQKKFKNWLTSKGIYRNWANAYKTWSKNKDKGYHIYDTNGKQLD